MNRTVGGKRSSSDVDVLSPGDGGRRMGTRKRNPTTLAEYKQVCEQRVGGAFGIRITTISIFSFFRSHSHSHSHSQYSRSLRERV